MCLTPENPEYEVRCGHSEMGFASDGESLEENEEKNRAATGKNLGKLRETVKMLPRKGEAGVS